MSDTKKPLELIAYRDDIDRNMAIAAALELIKTDLSSAPTSTRNRLLDHMELLSVYADKIEAAMTTKN